jgi:hypothetical protein
MYRLPMRWWAASILCVVLFPMIARAVPADVASGIRQVKEGDLEAGVATLEAAVHALANDRSRTRDIARAHLYIGIAKVGLGDMPAARTSFHRSLALDPSLRLTSLEFSPRVVNAFDNARRDAPPSTAPSGRAAVPLLVVGGGAAAAGVVVLSTGGSGDAADDRVRFTDVGFATPTIVCSNGHRDVSIPVSLLVNVTNSRDDTATITQVESTLTIVSSTFSDEIGFTSRRPTSFSPGGIGPRSMVTLRLDTTLLCTNDAGNPERSNTWTAEVAITSNLASAILRTADLLRVEIP